MEREALLNILSGFVKIFTSILFGFIVTRLLVKDLGGEVYGLVPLITSMNQYVSLFVMMLTASTARFVSLSYNENNLTEANGYYSTSFYGLTVISTVIFVFTIFASYYLGSIFSIPEDYVKEVQYLFILSILSFLILSIASVFYVGPFIKHRIYLTDFTEILGKILQLIFIIFLYNFSSVTLVNFGFSSLIFGVTVVFVCFFVSRKIMPELTITRNNFNRNKLNKMVAMGTGSSLNTLGMLLYTNSDIVIVNILLGSIFSGYYGISIQLSIIITVFGGLLARLFNPHFVELISKKDTLEIINSIKNYSMILSSLNGLILSLLVVFSQYVLYIWLGEEFSHLYILVGLLSLYHFLHQSTVLSFVYISMSNNLRIPSIVTIFAGFFNVILTIVLIKFTDLGMYGAVVATLTTIILKTVVFNVIYAAFLLEVSPFILWRPVFRSMLQPSLFILLGLLITDRYTVYGAYEFIVIILLFSITYIWLMYYLFFNNTEKRYFVKLIKLDKFLSV
jgi:O-antigen/teichoic acid export membrane protein